MRIRSRYLMSIATAALVGGSVMGGRTSARAALISDEFPFPGDASYRGIPDLDTHSGLFVDAINQANQSVTSEANPAFFVVTFPAGAATENIFVFDGNNAGLWDQKSVDVNFNLPNGTLSANANPLTNAITYFEVFAYGDAPLSATPVWVGQSQVFPAAPQAADYIFEDANDSKWELFLDAAAQLTPAQRGAASLATGEHRYFVRVQFKVPVTTAINGYKIGVNGGLTMTSDPATPGSHLWLGGFICGVVDGQRDVNVPTKVGSNYSFSRDHYPDILKPGTDGLHLPWSDLTTFDNNDTFANTFKGQMDFHVLIEPGAGQTTEEYVISELVLENGDFDDRFDLMRPNKVTGILEPHPIGYPDSHGQPADQGGPYSGAVVTDVFDSAGFALPLPSFPPGPADLGAPFVEIYAPGIVPLPDGSNATMLVRDLSGNVPPSGDAGFESIPVPVTSLPPAERVPGVWTLRFKNVDARNSVFIRSNAAFLTGPCLKGRVFCDVNQDGDDELGTDPGIPGVTVKITRTDVASPTVNVLTNANGGWEGPANLAAGTYDIEVDPAQLAIGGKPATTPVKFTKTLGEFDCGFANYGFNCTTCECKNGRMMKEVCFTTDLWVGNPRPSYDIVIDWRAGCCEDKKKCSSPLVDRSEVHFTLPFAGPVVSPNGAIEMRDATVSAGVMTITFCLKASGPTAPNGWFEGRQSLSVMATGSGNKWCDEKHACSCITCASAQVGKGWPPCGTTCEAPFTVVTTTVANCDEVPPPPPDCGCTFTQGWWKNHSKYSKNTSQRIAWPGGCSEDTKLCGKKWLSILQCSPRGNSWLILAHQWIAASLNQCRGACVPQEVAQALTTARILLEENCGGFCYGPKRKLAIQLSELLDDYNNGLLGVPHCGSNKKAPPPEVCPENKKPTPSTKSKHDGRGSGY